MTPQELQNSVLQMAFQGKLVEQIPSEGSGEELLSLIRSEKQRLIKEKRVKKDKALPDITEEDFPFDIPDSWAWAFVGDIFMHNTGKAQNASGSDKGVIRKFITTSNLYWNRFDFSKVKEMPFTEQELERCTVKKGDLLVCEGGDCGRSAIWNYDEEVCIQNHVHRLRPYAEISIEYFYHLFYLYKFTGRLRGRGVAIQGLSNDAIHKVICPLPPLAEQKRIVAKIEELLPLLDRYEQAWTKLEDFNKRFPVDMQKSILQMAIQGKIVSQDPSEGTGEDLYNRIKTEEPEEGGVKHRGKGKNVILPVPDDVPFDIPETWKWVRLGSIGYTNIGLTYSPKDVANEGTIVLRSSNIQNGQMDYGDLVRINGDIPDNKMCKVGDILICARNGSKRLVGKAALVDKEGMSFGAFMAIFRSICNDYVLNVINSAYFRNSLLGDTGTTTINQITQDMLKNALIPLPPLAEQKRIVSRLNELLPLCEKLK